VTTVSLSDTTALTLDQLQSIALEGADVTLTHGARERIALGREVLEAALVSGTRVYGLNTGLGHNRDVDVPQDVLDQYQVDIVTSHASAIGKPLPAAEVRAIMTARLSGACRGYSGLSLEVTEFYAKMLNAGIIPNVPSEGTIGASDLGTLAAVAATMIGRGTAFVQGRKLPSAEALAEVGLRPVTLGLKEGLAVVSENSYSIGVGALALGEVARTLRLADVASALTMEATASSLSPFDPEVTVARPFQGQAQVARNILRLLQGSYLTDPTSALSLQAPLSIRTVAQVHGAAREVFGNTAYAVETELNASDDNPMVSPDTKRALSTGNFHPMEIALGFESLRVALAHLALIADRRISVLGQTYWSAQKTDPSDLPDGAIVTPGLGGYSYASLSARIKALAAPVTLGIPSLDHGQEDHATAAPLAVDVTRQVTAMLDEMLVGEIVLAAALLSRRHGVELGSGTRPYVDTVIAAAREGDPDELAVELVSRVSPRLVAMTSRRADLLHDEDETGSFPPAPLHRPREKAPSSHDIHATAV